MSSFQEQHPPCPRCEIANNPRNGSCWSCGLLLPFPIINGRYAVPVWVEIQKKVVK